MYIQLTFGLKLIICNLEQKFYLLHTDMKRLPRTFIYSANTDAFQWT